MQWSDISFKPASRTLRQFAGLWLIFLAGLAWWQGFVRDNRPLALVFAALAIAIGLPGLVKPPAIRWVFVAAQLVTFPIGWVISHVMLAVLFYGMFTPLALVFRLMKRDALALRRKPGVSTYWTPKPAAADARSYFSQF